MKHGWKTRIDERRYFEEKLAARKARIEQLAMQDYRDACNVARIQASMMNVGMNSRMNSSKESINGKQWL